MTFSNDGSFMEQFKKMQEAKTKGPSSSSSVSSAPVNPPPPPPPTQVKTEPKPPMTKSAPPAPLPKREEEGEWYKGALEKARLIAKGMHPTPAQEAGPVPVKTEVPQPATPVLDPIQAAIQKAKLIAQAIAPPTDGVKSEPSGSSEYGNNFIQHPFVEFMILPST